MISEKSSYYYIVNRRVGRRMKILFLTTLIPFPYNDGGKIKTYNTLSVLSKNHDIDVLCFSEEQISDGQESQMSKVCHNLISFRREITAVTHKRTAILLCFKSLFVSAPYVMYKYFDKRCIAFFKKQLKKEEYDIIYVDHLQMSIYFPYLKEISSTIILDEHNCESVILKRRIEQIHNPLVKMFYILEYKKLREFERKSLLSADRVIILSEQDEKLMNELCGTDLSNKSYQLPIMVKNNIIKDVNDYKPDEHTNILFLGTLTWEPNNNGMVWFVQNVVPLLDMKNIDIYIVGKNPSDHLKSLCKSYKQIHIVGYAEDIEVYFKKCDFMVVPLFIGSGQRVKIIESFSRGFPVISTTIGAEGLQYLDSENILIANTKDEFVTSVERLKDLDTYNNISVNSRKVYENSYSEYALKQSISQSIEL